ncbi:MAG: thiolase family protein [Candidatus Melainabacteria bacterium]|nr:thiolase family protein [Candidatus Melainabacteria bacterium]
MADSKKQAYIVSALRTPFVRSRKGKKGGVFSNIHPTDLACSVIKEVIRKSNIEGHNVEDLIFGCAAQTGKQGFNTARLIALKALGRNVPGTTVNRLCGSSAETVNIAAAKIKSGEYDLIIAGGVESMSQVPIGSDMLPFAANLENIWKILTLGPKIIKETLPEDYRFYTMIESGGIVADKWNLTREELDEFSLNSHMKAKEATEKGYLKDQIVFIKTEFGLIDKDDGIRKDTSIEKLNSLKSVSKKNNLITAGNSSQITDGAAALLIASEEAVRKYNLKPKGKVIAEAVVGTDPDVQLDGPIHAIPLVLKKANLKLEDIDLFEINEAFASVVLATIKELRLDKNKVNVNGGAIALGHPLGASGARLLVTLLHELERRNLKRGLIALCIGGAQGIATIIERI